MARLRFTAVNSKCRPPGPNQRQLPPTAATTYVDYLRTAIVKIGHLVSKENMLWKRSALSPAHNFRRAKDVIHISEAEMEAALPGLFHLLVRSKNEINR